MLVRPRDLADRMAGARQPEVFTLPLDEARLKARETIRQDRAEGYVAVIENWQQLSDGQISFTIRHLRTVD